MPLGKYSIHISLFPKFIRIGNKKDKKQVYRGWKVFKGENAVMWKTSYVIFYALFITVSREATPEEIANPIYKWSSK